MSKEIDVLILVEHKDRELQSAVLLKEWLVSENGLTVEIASLVFDLWKIIQKYKPNYIILPYCRWEKTNSVVLFGYLYKNQVKFINLNYEQICNSSLNEEKKPRDRFARDDLLYSCWGQSSKRFFMDCGVPNEHLFVTGKLENFILDRMANSDRKNLKIQISAEHPELKAEEKWIFAPMDDNWVFLKDLTEKFYKKGTWSKEKVIEYKTYLSDTVYMFLDWVCNLDEAAMKDNRIRIIIRPHPGVGIQYYQEYFNKRMGMIPKFVYLSKEYTAKEWIVACDKCVSNYSTLLLDSSYIGVPSGLICKEEIPENIKMDWFDDIRRLQSQTSFDDFILLEENGNQSHEVLEKYIDTSKNPLKEIASFIVSNNKNSDDNFSALRLLKTVICRFKYFAPSLLRTCAYKLHLNAFGLDKLKYDYLTIDNVTTTKKNLGRWFNI